MIHSTISRKLLAVGAFAAFAGLASCSSSTTTPPTPTVTPSAAYTETILVSDQSGMGATNPTPDPTLINEWGMSIGKTGIWWLSSNGGGVTNVYSSLGIPLQGLNPVPVSSRKSGGKGSPTGVVANSTVDFKGGHFIYCSLDGIITAWTGGATTVIEATDSTAKYTGMALASNGGANFLYVADFANKKIVVYDKNYTLTTLTGSFTDNASPAIPAAAGPYNIALVGGQLYVTYSTFGPLAGNGYISVFNLDGTFVKRFASNGTLNEPWGIAIAPSTFDAKFKNALLVGNFGDGTINGYNASTGAYLGQISKDTISTPLKIDGLWGLTVTSSAGGNDSTAVYFTAGPSSETHGLFGFIKPK